MCREECVRRDREGGSLRELLQIRCDHEHTVKQRERAEDNTLDGTYVTCNNSLAVVVQTQTSAQIKKNVFSFTRGVECNLLHNLK